MAGSGGIGSVNYETTLLDGDVMDMNLRLGFSVAPIDKNNGVGLVFPVMLHHVFGKNSHKLDVGWGQSLTLSTKGSLFLLTPLSFGYRFEPVEKRYYFRASYTPLVSYLIDFQWQNWAGLTFGYKLNRENE